MSIAQPSTTKPLDTCFEQDHDEDKENEEEIEEDEEETKRR